MIADLKAGTIHAIVLQDPFRIGYEAVHTLAMKLRGRTPPKRMDLSGVVVRREDLDKPEVRRLLDPGAPEPRPNLSRTGR
jgi:ribose transport system substrate-binding protein